MRLMKAIGIVRKVDFEVLKDSIFSIENIRKEEDIVFSQMYKERLFPEELDVRYDYGGGTYKGKYGDRKHQLRCKEIFRSFFTLWGENREKDCFFVKAAELSLLEKQVSYTDTYGQPFYCVYESEQGFYVSHGNISAFLPKTVVEIQLFQDYSHTPSHLLSTSPLSDALLPSVGEETECSLKEKMKQKQNEIEEQVLEIEEQKKAKEAEIEQLKRAIEEKYQSVFATLEMKKSELEQMKTSLEEQLFLLDTQIYGIRCMNGEVIRFTKVSSGLNAPVSTPAVLYQKIRFLDEELAKYVSLYCFDGEDTAMFEELLRKRDDLRDLFFPQGKTVSLIRISHDGVSYKSSQNISASSSGVVSVYNVLDAYEVYHGNQIAILIRNGENCYIGWTEYDRVFISGENVFLTPEQKIENPDDVKKDYFGKVIEEHTDKKEVAARFFIFSIIQGAIQNGILNLPKDACVSPNNPYVIFSMADNWLADDTYGSFDDIMDKCNVNIQKGDFVLTLQSLTAEGNKYSSHCNDRGRGYANRTHDVHAKDCTIYPVNLVEDDESENLVLYEAKPKKENSPWKKRTYTTREDAEHFMNDFENHHDMDCYEFRDIQFMGPVKHIFISLLKDNFWTDSSARSNFELYRDEYINLTFLNTILLTYIITNRKMPHAYFHSRVNFSYILPYLNTAIAFLKEREEKEAALISKFVSLKENWQMKLTEWKLANNVHVITEYQAKRFAKWYSKHLEEGVK